MPGALILTESTDIVGQALPGWLTSRGLPVPPMLFTDRPETWPAWTLSVSPPDGVLHFDAGDVDLAELTGVWMHRPFVHTAEDGERLAPLIDVLEALPIVRFNDRAVRDHSQFKLLAHELARSVGLRVPRTFVGHQGAAAFIRGPTVFKTLAGSASSDMQGLGGVLTTRVRPEQLADERSLRLCPVLLQDEIPRAAEVRAIVVGDAVFAAELPVEDAALDWRRLGPAQVDLWRRAALPDDVAAALVALHQRLGLWFGTADLLRTPEGEHVFLETNATGGFFWVSELHGGAPMLRILDALRGAPAGGPRALPRVRGAEEGALGSR